MQTIAIHQDPSAYSFFGGALDFWRYKGQECILSGPYETGKTVAALTKLHALLVKYPNARAFITRQTYKSLIPTAIVTYEKKVLPVPPESPDSVIVKYGGSKPDFYQYPNGSNLLVVGMDSPDKLLSGEFDFGYVNQAEEISLDAWEKLVGRCTGRAGNAPYTQVMGDCNPSVPTHWILHRVSLRMFEQRHEHNPSLYDQDRREWTEQGKKSIAILSSLTGIRKKRGFLGIWASNEGVVYESFDRDIHLIDKSDAPKALTWYLAIDFGYTNPFVCQLWGVDHDGRMYLWSEIYFTKRTINQHIPFIRTMIAGKPIRAIVADHDAEDRATLAEYGFETTAAKKAISPGIQAVEDRLKDAGDGKPRLFITKDACVNFDSELFKEYAGDSGPCSTEHEFPLYEWPEDKEGRPIKETPLDINNHGMDAMRYMVMYLDNPTEIKASPRW
jgi:hypothetical protein